MQIARPATAGADRQLAGELRLGAGREGRGLLVARVYPVDIATLSQRFGDAVQTIADDAVGTGERPLSGEFR